MCLMAAHFVDQQTPVTSKMEVKLKVISMSRRRHVTCVIISHVCACRSDSR